MKCDESERERWEERESDCLASPLNCSGCQQVLQLNLHSHLDKPNKGQTGKHGVETTPSWRRLVNNLLHLIVFAGKLLNSVMRAGR